MTSLVVAPQACLFVLSGPCGTGKTSLAEAWRKAEPELGYTRSVTTRDRRPGEPDHYDRVERSEFERMIADAAFVQWIRPTYDEYYGTLRAPIDAAISEGRDMVFDYCPEGTLNLLRVYTKHVVPIWIMAPTVAAMRDRLRGRGTESTDEQEQRHAMALADFNFVDMHRYHVINDDFDSALATLRAIRLAERARLDRQPAARDQYAAAASPALLRYYAPVESASGQ